MRTDARDTMVSVITAVFLVVTGFAFFQFVQPYHLFFKEQTQLFLFTSEYFLSYLDKPGALSCFIGDFLTQFLYLRGGGASVVSLLFLIEWVVVCSVLKRFGVGVLTPLWALLPVIADWFFMSRIYYTLAIPVSLILALLFFLLYSAIRRKRIAFLTGVFFVPLLYSLTGAGMLFFILLVFLYEIYRKRGMVSGSLFLLLIGGVYPSCVRYFYLLTAGQAWLYPFVQWRYALSGVVVLGLVVVPAFSPEQRSRVTARVFFVYMLTLFIIWTGSLAFATDKSRETILALASEACYENWDRVYDLAAKEKLPHSMATYYANIALSKRGELGDRLMEYYQPGPSALFIPVNPDTGWFGIFFSSDVFYYLGDMNMAQHSAMLGMIFSPCHRSSRMVKRLAEINLALGDSTATEKYLRLLDATLFHKKWAGRMREALYSDRPENYPWLMEKRAQLATYDTLRLAADYRKALKVSVESNPDNRAALDYLLCYFLLNKDLPSFKAVFDTYCKGKMTYIPRAYSEALLISLAAAGASEKEFKSYAFDNRVVKEFAEYTAIYEQAKGMLEPVRERFPATYWMYYHFARIKEE